MDEKMLVRISPLLLGKLGDTASEVKSGAVIVQFAGQIARFDDGEEWHVTHAVLSNSLDVVDIEARQAHNKEVEQVVREKNLTHIGWLRQVSEECPLSSLDIDTQRVYETHTRDAFAAMLDISDGPNWPCLFFYCLTGGPGPALLPGTSKRGGGTFMPAHHVVLDSSIPYSIIRCAIHSPTPTEKVLAAAQSDHRHSSSGNSSDSDTVMMAE